jgi:hypothetical protein
LHGLDGVAGHFFDFGEPRGKLRRGEFAIPELEGEEAIGVHANGGEPLSDFVVEFAGERGAVGFSRSLGARRKLVELVAKGALGGDVPGADMKAGGFACGATFELREPLHPAPLIVARAQAAFDPALGHLSEEQSVQQSRILKENCEGVFHAGTAPSSLLSEPDGPVAKSGGVAADQPTM